MGSWNRRLVFISQVNKFYARSANYAGGNHFAFWFIDVFMTHYFEPTFVVYTSAAWWKIERLQILPVLQTSTVSISISHLNANSCRIWPISLYDCERKCLRESLLPDKAFTVRSKVRTEPKARFDRHMESSKSFIPYMGKAWEHILGNCAALNPQPKPSGGVELLPNLSCSNPYNIVFDSNTAR